MLGKRRRPRSCVEIGLLIEKEWQCSNIKLFTSIGIASMEDKLFIHLKVCIFFFKREIVPPRFVIV